jgi:NitT/TauT family transport system ATP-binding protein
VLAAGKVLRLQLEQKQFRSAETAVTQTILRDVTLEVADGEFVCLFGPSGCGKTTLLNLIAQIDPDFSGTLTFAEEARLGYVFQDPRLLPWRTVEQNLRLALPPALRHSEQPWRFLERMGVGHTRKAFPNELSLGMARRVALARAFAVQPQLLLMDEPFVSLDAHNAEVLRELLLEVWLEHRCAVLLVTHDLDEALRFADRLLCFGGSPTTLLRELPIATPRAERTVDVCAALKAQIAEQTH